MDTPAPDASAELVERMMAGDRDALEALLRRHLPEVRAFLRLRMGATFRAKESSSDLAQSVVREVLQHRDRFRFPGNDGFRRWLFETALRKVRNRQAYWLAEKRDVGRETPPVPADDGSRDADLLAGYGSICTPSREVAAREQVERIEQAIDRLPEEQREVLVLAKIEGLSRAEIAVELDRSEASVRSLLYRATIRLAELLDPGPPSAA